MVVGGVFSIVMLIIFLGDATHPHTGYYTLAVEAAMLGVGIALVFAPWIASFTESVEEKNPALVATGLALWGWVLRVTIGAALIVITLIITSVNPMVDNLPVANTVIHGQTMANFVAEHPKTIAFATSHTRSWPYWPRTRRRPLRSGPTPHPPTSRRQKRHSVWRV